MTSTNEKNGSNNQKPTTAPAPKNGNGKKSKSKKQWTQIVEALQSPASIGILITLISCFIAFQFYSIQNNIEIQEFKNSFLYQIIEVIDQKTMDFRFRLRGPVSTEKEKLGVLAIDDESLNQIGRWPWSREKIAYLIDQVMTQNAKAMGFDMVFSEPQENKSFKLLDQIEKMNIAGTPQLQEFITQEKKSSQPDLVLADVIKKHRDKLILGAFSDEEEYFRAYQDICFDAAFKINQSYQMIDAEELPITPFIFNNYYTKESKRGYWFENTPFQKYFDPKFKVIKDEVANNLLTNKFLKNSSDDLNDIEKADLKISQERALEDYCSSWLDKKRDRFFADWEKDWKTIFADIKEYQASPFEDTLVHFKYMYFNLNPIPRKRRWTINIPPLIKASAHNALFDATLDSDGSIRRSNLVLRVGFNYAPSLALQTFLVSQGYQAHITLDKDPSNGQQFKVDHFDIKNPETNETKFLIPTDNRGRIKINYAGPQKSYPYVSAAEFFHTRPQIKIKQTVQDPVTHSWKQEEKTVDRAEFMKDRIFILGATAIGVYDLRVTPFDENYPGVETHVNVLGNLIANNFLHAHPKEFQYMMLTMFLLGLLITFALTHLGALAGAALTLLTAAGIFVFDFYFLFKNGIVATMAFPMMLVIIIYVTVTFYKYFTEERKKKYLRATFSKYVSPAIVDEILKDPENIELGGKKIRMSVFFSDIRGFTTISEKLDPQVLSSVLNEYLTPMTNIVFNNKGTLDKYMGDAVMAFFGAPIFFPDHGIYACRCALQSIEKLKEIQKQFQERGLPNIDIGIGINTSEMSVGNMGSDIVRSYTVMGDAVNLGSRLEGINKEYGTRIIISEFTYEDVKNNFVTREVDWVRVKGKYKPVKIYELIAEGQTTPEKQKVLDQYNQGYKLYRERKFTEALEFFKKGFELDPKDPVCELYIERCEEFIQHPPPQDWDGVFIMKTK